MDPSSSALYKVSLHCALEPTAILMLPAARASHAGPSLLTLYPLPQKNVSPGVAQNLGAKILVDQFAGAGGILPGKLHRQKHWAGFTHQAHQGDQRHSPKTWCVGYRELHPCPRFPFV